MNQVIGEAALEAAVRVEAREKLVVPTGVIGQSKAICEKENQPTSIHNHVLRLER